MRSQNDLNDVFLAGRIKQHEILDGKVRLIMTITENVGQSGSRSYDVPAVAVGAIGKTLADRITALSRDDQALYLAVQGYLSPNYLPAEGEGKETEQIATLLTHLFYVGSDLIDQLSRVAISGEVAYHNDDKPTASGKPKQWMMLAIHRKNRQKSIRFSVPVIVYESNANLDVPISRGSDVAFTGRIETFIDPEKGHLRLQVIALNNLASNASKQATGVPEAAQRNFLSRPPAPALAPAPAPLPPAPLTPTPAPAAPAATGTRRPLPFE